MAHNGYVTHDRNAKITSHLSGPKVSESIPAGHQINSVVYYLRGGTKAQLEFLEHRKAETTRRLHLAVDNTSLAQQPTLSLLDPKYKCIETSGVDWQPRKNHVEYEYIPAPKKPATKHGNPATFKFNPKPPATGNIPPSFARKNAPSTIRIKKPQVPKKLGLKQRRTTTPSDSDSSERITSDEKSKASVESEDTLSEASGLVSQIDEDTPSSQKSIPVAAAKSEEAAETSSTVSSAPTSLFDVRCRCGSKKNGNEDYAADDEGEAVQCGKCGCWAHQACQMNGMSSLLRKNRPFLCPECLLNYKGKLVDFHGPLKVGMKNARTKWIKDANKPLKSRLRPGIGALARLGTYYYPVRLIIYKQETDEWRVKWWRGCQFEKDHPSMKPDLVTSVSSKDVVDGLWGKRKERRSIRLGQWTMSEDAPNDDKILSNLTSTPYNDRIHRVLSPWLPLLKMIMDNPDSLDEKDIPVLHWLRHGGTETFEGKRGIIPYVGDLTITDRAMIHNWFYVHVAEKKHLETVKWIAKAPIAHAITILIATSYAEAEHQDGEGIQMEELNIDEKVWEAWDFQKDFNNATPRESADPDLECLRILERQMFERSKAAGIAGHMQWGLDKGDHQNKWEPYINVPLEWNLENIKESDSELVRGPEYVELPVKEVEQEPQEPRKVSRRILPKRMAKQG